MHIGGGQREEASGRRRALRGGIGVAGVGLLVLTGCQIAGTGPEEFAGKDQLPAAAQPARLAELAVPTLKSRKDVRPDRPIVVEVRDGRLDRVSVTDRAGRAVEGRLAGDGARWESTSPLGYGTEYTVAASARNADGKLANLRTDFTTLKPKQTTGTDEVSPGDEDTVGVGTPIIVKFDRPVENRAAVERRLLVTSSRPAPGSWSWIDDDEVHYRPQRYWPAHTDVTVTVALRGVELEKGRWGDADSSRTFHIGPSMVSRVDSARHSMTVVRDGAVARVIPITTGKRGFTTRSGIKVITEKFRMKVMDARTIDIAQGSREYYRLRVPYAMRITDSGEFVHGAPWSVGSQGRANVSHGCIGMSVSNARWLFGMTSVGDVVQVVNTGRELEPNNGWTDWNVPWSSWKAGSAI